jgi:hypothetical protein
MDGQNDSHASLDARFRGPNEVACAGAHTLPILFSRMVDDSVAV